MIENKIYWLKEAMEGELPKGTAYYRCTGIENFIAKIEKTGRVIGIEFSGNNIGIVVGVPK